MSSKTGLAGAIALGGTVAALATAEWTGATGFLRYLGTYLPPHRIWLWWIPVAVFAFAVLASSWFWVFDHSWRKKWEATNAQAEQVALNIRQGYRPIAYLSTAHGRDLGYGSKEPTNIVQVGKAYTEFGSRHQPVKITEPSGLETEFAYSLLYDRSSWEHGSKTEFVGLDGKPVHILTALENASIRKTVQRSARVMCLGFASSDRRYTAVENEALSDDRAINLCEALVMLGYVSEERGGSVSLNSFRGLDKWISASVMLRPGLAAAG